MTGILANIPGVTDAAILASLESQIVTLRDAEIARTTIPGVYDLAHLQEFHRRLFGDLYVWAGQIRTVDIAKAPTQFCLWPHLESYATTSVFPAIEQSRYLRGLERADVVEAFAAQFAEVNALHPFREGNGRTQRAFFRQMLAAAGWRVDWAAVDPQRNIDACIASWRGDQEPLENMLSLILTRS